MSNSMKTRELTCIICPRGCALTVNFDSEGKVSEVSGNICVRGKNYAVTECTAPTRTVTSTVRCESGEVVSVKTESTVPKELVFKVMDEINSTTAHDGLKIGEVVIENVCGTGVNVIATSNGR